MIRSKSLVLILPREVSSPFSDTSPTYNIILIKYILWHSKNKKNKKVLLRECKRNTERRILSTPSAVLSRGGGYPTSGWESTPPSGQGLSLPGRGTPSVWGSPLDMAGVTPNPHGRTRTCENITFPTIRMRTVIKIRIIKRLCIFSNRCP